MAQAIRTVTSSEISQLLDTARKLNEIDSSLADTVMSYIESDDLDGAKVYMDAMSVDGLARSMRNMIRALPLMAATLIRKRILRTGEAG
jgi:hypothetical protein